MFLFFTSEWIRHFTATFFSYTSFFSFEIKYNFSNIGNWESWENIDNMDNLNIETKKYDAIKKHIEEKMEMIKNE